MSEQWENLIELEFEFFTNVRTHYEDLIEAFLENELNIQYPVTQFDSDEGRIYRSCPGTEEQAIRRIEVREKVEAALKRIDRRINRLMNALQQLNKKEQSLITAFYIERDVPHTVMKRELGFHSVKELHTARRKALLKMYKIYEKEREEAHFELREMLKSERQMKAMLMGKYLKEA